jgi:hypothetical protein
MMVESPPLRADSWERPSFFSRSVRDTAGEYLGVTFLRDGSLAVVTPIQSGRRVGFSWWRFDPPRK